MANRIHTAIVAEYRRRLGASPDFVAVDTHGLNVAQMSELRRLARERGIQVLVVKTSLACLALDNAAQPEALRGVVAGPTALVYGGEGLPAVARLVGEFGRKTGKLAVRGGVFEKKVLSRAEVDRFRTIPDRKTLLAQVLAAVTAPLSGTLGLVQSLLASPASLAEALAKKQEKPAA
jgi:large subunit ribosomal protein L10